MMPQLTNQDLEGSLAVVTGGGDGIGQALTLRLLGAGCSVAFCDISESGITATLEKSRTQAAGAATVSGHLCDVADEAQLETFRDKLLAEHGREAVNLVFLNAGVAGGASMIATDRAEWERTFNICWNGVYLGTRVFLPSLVAADWGRLVNTSSVNGFYASLGPDTAHTAYSAAKFAVKGFTEALIGDLRLNAPHVGASVVMPGHIGTGIVENTIEMHNFDTSEEADVFKTNFRENAPTTAVEAADIIVNAVLDGHWRILVGDDADRLDRAVRTTPDQAYDLDFDPKLIDTER